MQKDFAERFSGPASTSQQTAYDLAIQYADPRVFYAVKAKFDTLPKPKDGKKKRPKKKEKKKKKKGDEEVDTSGKVEFIDSFWF